MIIKIDKKNIPLLLPLTVFALGTLYVGADYGPVSAFIPFWASIFMVVTCLFVLGGFDGSDLSTDEPLEKSDVSNRSVLGAMIWITVFVILAYLMGLIAAAVIYTFCSMYIFGGKKLIIAVFTSLLLGLILFGLFEFVLEKELYRGVFVEEFI